MISRKNPTKNSGRNPRKNFWNHISGAFPVRFLRAFPEEIQERIPEGFLDEFRKECQRNSGRSPSRDFGRNNRINFRRHISVGFSERNPTKKNPEAGLKAIPEDMPRRILAKIPVWTPGPIPEWILVGALAGTLTESHVEFRKKSLAKLHKESQEKILKAYLLRNSWRNPRKEIW